MTSMPVWLARRIEPASSEAKSDKEKFLPVDVYSVKCYQWIRKRNAALIWLVCYLLIFMLHKASEYEGWTMLLRL